jgi:hypothetical protein
MSCPALADDIKCTVPLLFSKSQTGRISSIESIESSVGQKSVLVVAEEGLFKLTSDNNPIRVLGNEGEAGRITSIHKVNLPGRPQTVLVGGEKGLFKLTSDNNPIPVLDGERAKTGRISKTFGLPETVLVGGEKGLFKLTSDNRLDPVSGSEEAGWITSIHKVNLPGRPETVLIGGEKGLFKLTSDNRLDPVSGSGRTTQGWISSIVDIPSRNITLVRGARGLFVLTPPDPDNRLFLISGSEQTRHSWISSIVDLQQQKTVLVGGEKGLFELVTPDNRLTPVLDGEHKIGRIFSIVDLGDRGLVAGYEGLFTFFHETQKTKIEFFDGSERLPADPEDRPLYVGDKEIRVKLTSQCAEAISHSEAELIVTKSGTSKKEYSQDQKGREVNSPVDKPFQTTTMLFHVKFSQEGPYKLQVAYNKKEFNQSIPVNVKYGTEDGIVDKYTSLVMGNPVIFIGALIYLAVGAFSIVIYRFWPLTLLKMNNALALDKLVLDKGVKLPDAIGVLLAIIPLRYFLIIGFFHYRPRVLDAWVKAHINVARERFEKEPRVEQRAIHVVLPVTLNGQNRSDLTASDLQPIFATHLACLLIWGEGGAGKTHIACRIGKWVMEEEISARPCAQQMLPVLLDQELECGEKNSLQRLTDAIGRKLQILVDEPSPIPYELLEQLLRQRRVLVIVDHLSEMSEETQRGIQLAARDFSVNALVVTSRIEESLGPMQKSVIIPLRIAEASALVFFMQEYINRKLVLDRVELENSAGDVETVEVVGDQRTKFTGKEIVDGCSRFFTAVGKRHITPLLAKLFAEQMIAAKQRSLKDKLPDNIPDLMLNYMKALNDSVTRDKRFDNLTVQRDAKVVAWECVRLSYQPISAKWDDASKALIDVYGEKLTAEEAEVHLNYLLERLRVIEIFGAAENCVRFTLDPLAEYLGSLHAIDVYGKDEELWYTFLDRTDAIPGAPESIIEFLLALRECCLAHPTTVPTFVMAELDRLASTQVVEISEERRAGAAVSESD